MHLFSRIAGGLLAFVFRGRTETELDEELRAYFEAAVEQKIAAGMSREEANRKARAEVGSIAAAKDHVRDVGWESSIEALLQDIRHSWRSLARNRGFAAVAILTLALGIGANTAIFSVVNAVLLEPLPYRDPDRLVRLMANLPADESPTRAPLRMTMGLSVTELAEFRTRARTISHAGLSTIVFATWLGDERTVRVEGGRLSPAVLEMLGVQPQIGRLFSASEEAAGAGDVIILSHDMWQRHFGGDLGVLRRTLTLEAAGLANAFSGPAARTYSVIGVMPQGFDFDGNAQFWVPLAASAGPGRPPGGTLVARLADGVTPEATAADLGNIVRALRRHSDRVRYEVVREQDELVASVKPQLLVLTGAVGLVLLIACVNVANLLLARTASRTHEIAVRAALGAGRARIVRHLITESIMLALIGGAAGVLLAVGGLRLLQGLADTLGRIDVGAQFTLPRLDSIAVDGSVLAFTVLTSIIAGALFGLGPAIRYARFRPVESLKDRTSAAGAPGHGRRRTQSALVVAEIAMAVTLLVGAGLLIHSFAKLTSVDSGYRPENVLTFQLAIPQRPVPELARSSQDLVAQLRSLPRVQAAAYARQLPIVQVQESTSFRRTPAVPAEPGPPGADARLVGGAYFETLGIRVLAGRGLSDGDRAGQPRAVVINETLARRDFAGEQPVGRQVYIGRDSLPWEIVGVAQDVRQFGPAREPGPQFFADIRQWPQPDEAFIAFLGPYYAVRTQGDPAAMVTGIERVVQQLHPNASLHNVATMEQLVANSVASPRLYSVLLGLFAGIAAALAAIGVYGVVAYSVGQRTREIGIRLALGARRSQVLRLVLRQTAVVSAAGILAGVAGAAALTQYLEGMLFGVTPLDGATFLGVGALFGVLAAVAALVPARRATRVAPLVALRYE